MMIDDAANREGEAIAVANKYRIVAPGTGVHAPAQCQKGRKPKPPKKVKIHGMQIGQPTAYEDELEARYANYRALVNGQSRGVAVPRQS